MGRSYACDTDMTHPNLFPADHLSVARDAWAARLFSPSQSLSLADGVWHAVPRDDITGARAYCALTFAYHGIRGGKWKEAVERLIEAIGAFALADDVHGASLCHLVRARLCLAEDDFERSRQALNDALLEKERLTTGERVELLLELAALDRRIGDLGRALVHVAEAADILPAADQVLGGVFSAQVALLLIRVRNYHAALAEYSRIAPTHESPYLRVSRLGNQMACHLRLGNANAAETRARELLATPALVDLVAEDNFALVMAVIALAQVDAMDAAADALVAAGAIAERARLSRRSAAQYAVAAGLLAARRGEAQAAVALLEPICTARPRGMPAVLIGAALDALVECCRSLGEIQRSEMYRARALVFQDERRFGPVLEAIFDALHRDRPAGAEAPHT
jgi:tetratricopeptide (TPR) repeat protein